MVVKDGKDQLERALRGILSLKWIRLKHFLNRDLVAI